MISGTQILITIFFNPRHLSFVIFKEMRGRKVGHRIHVRLNQAGGDVLLFEGGYYHFADEAADAVERLLRRLEATPFSRFGDDTEVLTLPIIEWVIAELRATGVAETWKMPRAVPAPERA